MGQLEFRTKEQHNRLFGLLTKLHWLHHRKDLAYQYSEGRTDSTANLSVQECDALMDMLQKEVDKTEAPKEQTKLDKMRKKFFYYCHELGWKENGKLNYERINNWLLKFGYLKKLLNDYTEKELFTLLQQIEKVHKNKTNKADDKV
jgi:hypothetical protein